ncbi:MAG: FKBP-type peptidyl-prolyl cis-trans isomerase [Planctomycetes bacterium]|nr:FKBP-type peptidyl-prolyl cis-trans isomerase [Planctomycetota bacterium]
MIPVVLVGSLLWLATSTLPAQYFSSVGSEPRRTTRATWLGMSGEQNVAIEYGQPRWRAEHEGFMKRRSAEPLLLGKGALTTLWTDVPLAFGEGRLARGRWYVGARRDEQQEWSLVFFAADEVDAGGRAVVALLSGEPDLRVPLRVTREEQSMELFEITLRATGEKPQNLALSIAWGPYRMNVGLAAAFDERKPEGSPDFARTAEGKGRRTESGLVYEVLHAGSGEPPRPDDMLRVHYAAWLSDGTMFDSSYVRGEPSPLTSQWVVGGLAEAFQLMRPGSILRVTIPPELGHGAQGIGTVVPPNATLVYHLTLLGIDRR